MLCTIMCCFVKTTPVWPEHQFVYLLDVLPASFLHIPSLREAERGLGSGLHTQPTWAPGGTSGLGEGPPHPTDPGGSQQASG